MGPGQNPQYTGAVQRREAVGCSQGLKMSPQKTTETQSFWVAPRPKDKSGVVYDELSDTDKKKSTHLDSKKSTTC